MNKKTALITGVTGQDGSYLSEFLLSKGYLVIGLYRRSSSSSKNKLKNIQHLLDNNNFVLFSGDVTDISSLMNAIKTYKPDEIYNLAAQSHVGESFTIPQATMQVNGIGVLNVLEAIRLLDNKIKLYQASTSEMFGDLQAVQSENTPFNPVSPYACSKVYAHNIVVNYRKAYGLFACCGILFNHESPRRGEDFVTRKITKAAARIHLGLQKDIRLGNIKTYRDWGYAGDYVEAMWMMLQQQEADDFVISSNNSITVEDFLQIVFKKLNMDYRDYLVIDQKFFRPHDVPYLRGDSSKAQKTLGWKPKVDLEELATMMLNHDLMEVRNENK
jgi:GDPmannose 4,6-dehydratase